MAININWKQIYYFIKKFELEIPLLIYVNIFESEHVHINLKFYSKIIFYILIRFLFYCSIGISLKFTFNIVKLLINDIKLTIIIFN